MTRRFLIAGGSGQIGQMLTDHLLSEGHEVISLSRRAYESHHDQLKTLRWDGETLGEWASELDHIDIVINLVGRTVNCRYTPNNLREMMDSRVNSTRVIGEAISQASTPPELWLQMSTATIYAHRFDASNDEDTGIIGGDEPDAPDYWAYSVEIAKRWEQTLDEANTPHTRKVSLRAAMTMSPSLGGIFDTLYRITRCRLGGPVGGGQQYISWIHERDFIRALELIIKTPGLQGPINLCAPNPLTQREFMAALRREMKIHIGLPATRWMAEIGAFFMRTDTELLLKSRRVVPTRLTEQGMEFEFPSWDEAARELVSRREQINRRS